MTDNPSYKVRVLFTDNSWVEFYADSSYENVANGRVLVWDDVLIDGKRLKYYSIPVHRIKSVEEKNIAE